MAGMARKPRELVAGGLYHLWARGNRRALIYEDDEDREAYLALLGKTAQWHGWRCLMYCLMDNHVHLLVETPQPNLDIGMRVFHGVVCAGVQPPAHACRPCLPGPLWRRPVEGRRAADHRGGVHRGQPRCGGTVQGGVRLAVEQPRGGGHGRCSARGSTRRGCSSTSAPPEAIRGCGTPAPSRSGAAWQYPRPHARPTDHRALRPLVRSSAQRRPGARRQAPDDRPGGRGGGRPRRRGVVPRGPADAGGVPGQAGPAVHPRQRGRWRGPQRSRGRRGQARRPRGGVLHARRVRGGRGRAGVPHLQAPRRAGLRAGRRAGPQLPHGLLRAEAARASGRRRDGAGARRRGRRRDGGDPGRQGPGRDRLRGRVDRREGADRPRGGRGRGLPLRRPLEGRGQGSAPAAAWTS